VILAVVALTECIGVLVEVFGCTRLDIDFAVANRGRVVLGGVACAASLSVGEGFEETL